MRGKKNQSMFYMISGKDLRKIFVAYAVEANSLENAKKVARKEFGSLEGISVRRLRTSEIKRILKESSPK